MDDILTIQQLTIDEVKPGQVSRFWLQLTSDALGNPVCIPVMVARGQADGPVLGITAALHGNELNGLPLIHQLFQGLPVSQLRGAVVAVPVANSPGFLRNQRVFGDGVDLNRIMPGKRDGNHSELYAARLIDRFALAQLDYLIDLHTASFGRINTFYIRADMDQPLVAALARRQNPQIILHNEGATGTWRRLAAESGVHAITVEINDPHRFQDDRIQTALKGIKDSLVHLDMIEGSVEPAAVPAIECARSYWLYTDRGGILEVLPQLARRVTKGERIAQLSNIFGDVIHHYTAPEDGVVIGKSINPVNDAGGRILHLGIELR